MGVPPIDPCYHPPIRRPDAVGLDPRVCVHPTVLPPQEKFMSFNLAQFYKFC